MSEIKIVDSQLLYFMASDSGLVKIGISNNPKKRAAALSSASGMRTLVIAAWRVADAFAAEQSLHRNFSKYRKYGEWFSGITQWDVDRRINEKIEESKIIIEPIEFRNVKAKPRPHRIFSAPCIGGVNEAVYLMSQEPKSYEDLRALSIKQRRAFGSMPESQRKIINEVRESTGLDVWATTGFTGMPSKINRDCYSLVGDYFLGEERALMAQILHNDALSKQASDASDNARCRLFLLGMSAESAP
jgi:hypothetical protein